MNVGDLKKILDALPDDMDINIEIYRHGKVESNTLINSLEIDGDLSQLVVKGIFKDKE